MRTPTARRAHHLIPRSLVVLCLLLTAACSDPTPSRTQPEGATGVLAKALIVAERQEGVCESRVRLAYEWYDEVRDKMLPICCPDLSFGLRTTTYLYFAALMNWLKASHQTTTVV